MSAASIVVAAFSPSSRGDLPSPRSRCLVLRNVARPLYNLSAVWSRICYSARGLRLSCAFHMSTDVCLLYCR